MLYKVFSIKKSRQAMKIVWVLLQTTRELNLFYVFEPLIQSLGTGELLEIKKVVLYSDY